MLRSGAAEPGNVLRAGEYRVPPRLAAMARPFEAWADGVPDLAPRHLASARTWVCEGQRVLSIRAARGGLRVIAGAADDSNAGTSVNLTLTAAPTDDELGQVVRRAADLAQLPIGSQESAKVLLRLDRPNHEKVRLADS